MSRYLRGHLSGCIAFLFVAWMSPGQAQTPPSFPGAQGFGATATGARGYTTVYHVTNLNDSGVGSFRAGVGTANQTVVFDVGGYVQILSPVSVASNVTIAGQTAPGQGFGVFGCEVSFANSSNDIVRFIRFRDGSLDPNWPGVTGTSGSTNCVNLLNTTTMIFDHCSMEFGAYNDIDANPAVDLTMQNCLIADPILYQQFNFHLQGGPVTFIGNIFANALNRSVFGKANLQYVNNVVYNYVSGFTTENSGAVFDYDFINNNYIPGPSTTDPSDAYVQIDNFQSAYATGNLVDGVSSNTLDAANVLTSEYFTTANAPTCPTSSLPMVSATTALVNNLANSGALPRDQVDAQVVTQVESLGTIGSLFSTQADTGLTNSGYGTITGGNNATDTDQDGMPDYWETAMGFGVSSDSGPLMASDGSGYTNLEEYLNWLAVPHSASQENASVQIDLSPYTTGLTGPTYTVSALNTGTAILPAGIGAAATTNSGTVTVSGSMVTYTPTANTVGLGGFTFTATAANGTITNTVYVCTTATTLPAQTGGGGGGGGSVAGTWTGGDATNGDWSDADNWNAGGAPGATTGVTSTADATFNAAPLVGASDSGTWGNGATNQIVIDQTTQNIGGINFDTATGSYFIGTTNGNPLYLTSGGTIEILSTLTATDAIETINAPLVLEGGYTLDNNCPSSTGAGSGLFNINGGITPASGVAATLTLSGGNTDNSSSNSFINGVIGNGPGGVVMSLVKSGTGIWSLTGVNTYTGTTTVSDGTLELGSGAVINGGTTAVSGGGVLQVNTGSVLNTTSPVNLTGGQIVVNGGSLTTSVSSNITAGSIGLFVESGTATFNGGLTTDTNGDTNWLISVTGGTLATSSLSMGRGYAGSDFTTQALAEAGVTNFGLVINGGAVNITGALEMGNQSTSVNSSVNLQLDSGSITVGGTTTITDSTNGRFSAIDVFGGTFTSNDTTGAGIKIGGFDAATSDELYVNGGTVNADTVTMGDGSQTSGTDILHVNAGALYVGTGGMVKGETSGTSVNTITLSGGTLGAAGNWSSSLNMALSGGTIRTANAAGTAETITLSGVLSGTSSLKEAGDGFLTVSGTNTYTGGTTFSGGTVEFTKTTAMPSSGTVTVSNGATLAVMVGSGTGQFTNSTSTTTNGSIGTLLAGKGGQGATVTFSSGSALGLDTTNATGGFAYAGNITTSGLGLNKLGTGTLTLTGTNTYGGGTTISAGTLQIGNGTSNGSLGTGAVTDNSVLIFDPLSASTIANVISGSGTVTKNGTGPTTLSGANTYTGGTTVSAGTLQVGNGTSNGSLGTGAVTDNSALVFDPLSTSTIANAISGSGSVTQSGPGTVTLSGANTYTGGTTVNGGTLQVGNGTGNGSLGTGAVTDNSALVFDPLSSSTIANAISGSGTVTQSGSGTVTLSGANTYTGGTTVNGGTLTVNTGGTLGATTGALAVNGATLSLGANVTVGAVTLGGGTISGAGALTGTSYTSTGGTISASLGDAGAGGSFTNTSGTIGVSHAETGAGSSFTNTSGTTTLSGVNSYTGATTVSGGELIVTSNLTSSSSISVASGATLDLTGATVSTSGTITNNGTLILGPGVTLTSTSDTFINNGTLDLTNDPSFTLPSNFVNNGTVLGGNTGTVPATDTPTMPPWAVALLMVLFLIASVPLLAEKKS